jgi:hypothetical protein
MKRTVILFLISLLIIPAFSQNIIKRKVVTEPFNALVAGGISEIKLIKGDEHVVVVEAPDYLQDRIKVKVSDGKLIISYKNLKLKNNEDLIFYITTPKMNNVDVSGAADLETVDVLTTDQFTLKASGASDVDMNLDVKQLNVNASGAADVTLTGKSVNEDVVLSGAADFTAKELVADTVKVIASGAASAYVNVLHSIQYKTSGAATVKYKGNPDMILKSDSSPNGQKIIINQGDDATKVYSSGGYDDYSDTVKVKIGSVDIEVIDDDTVTIRLGGHQLKVDEDGNIKWETVKKPRFNGHWGGVEMGINGYLTNDFNTNWDKEYDYLNLKYEKSWFVNLNLWEQNIAFNKKKTIGMMTGVGMSWNNYRFSNSTYLVSGNSEIKGYYMVTKAYYDPDSIYTNQNLVRKSKLTNMYINVPVLFEFQTNNPSRYKRFHFTAGGVIGLRVITHTKVYFNMANQEYKLQDPVTGQYLPQVYRTPNDTKRNIVKEHDSFYQSPVKFDARVSIGYGWLNLFATYSINGMFQDGNGPKLHPWTLGLTLVGW